jgi:hypothetical protein
MCNSWYQDGIASLKIIEGGKMNEFDPSKKKFAIDQDEANINRLVLEYTHEGENDASLNIQYMTKCEGKLDTVDSLDESTSLEYAVCRWEYICVQLYNPIAY